MNIALNKKLKKAGLKCAFVRTLHFRGKKPQELCALRLSVLLTTPETLEYKIQTAQNLEGKIQNLKLQGIKSKHPQTLGVQFAIYPNYFN